MPLRNFTIGAGALAFVVLAGSGPLHAEWYLGGEAGWSLLEDQTDRIAGTANIQKSFDSGYALGVRGGYQFGPWRIEEEYMYRSNDLDRLSFGGVNIHGSSGSRNSHAIMTNVLYDINVGWVVTPHIGAGIGAVDVMESAKAPGIGSLGNDESWEFGYQAIAGASYNFNSNWAAELDYRYLATTDTSFRLGNVGTVTYKTGYGTHNIVASLVYHFQPPPPPPPAPIPAAAPAPPPSRQVFLVFFDWDRDTITTVGSHIIQQAADAYRSGGQVQIQVVGYTDRSGSPGYNQRLSERRANNVANALAQNGVPRNQMAVSGRGENENRVPTADGVREPQNRRVEILVP